MLHTKEFYEIMEYFERYAKKNVTTGHMGMQREPKEHWEKTWYYSDGRCNEAFKLFFSGYMFAKSVNQQEQLTENE